MKTSIPAPVFLVGAERSGTTLLRLMLDHHPEITFHHEFQFSVIQINDDGTFPELGEYYEHLATDRIFNSSNFHIDKSLCYADLIKSFLHQKWERAGKKRFIGATVHRKFDHIHQIWPDARYIHIVRDGRAVGRSLVEMGWVGNIYMAVDHWVKAEETWEMMEKTLPIDHYINVKYEDFIDETDRVLTDICHFIGTSFNREMYEYANNSTYSLPNPNTIDKWKCKLGKRQVQQAEVKIAELLQKNGYQLSGYKLNRISRFGDFYLRANSKFKRALYWAHRYSLPLYLANKILRKIGPKSWRAHVQLKLNQIDQKYVK